MAKPFGNPASAINCFALARFVSPFRPIHAVFDVVIDLVAVDKNPHAAALGFVDRVTVDREADRLPHPLVHGRGSWGLESPGIRAKNSPDTTGAGCNFGLLLTWAIISSGTS
jgi:hypothetical protein